MVSLIATLLAVAVPAFLSHLRTSKLSEASMLLGDMHRRTAAYYQSPQGRARQLQCIPQSAGPTPNKPKPNRRKINFHSPRVSGAQTWRAIGFRPVEPIRFRYTLSALQPGCQKAGKPMSPLLTYTAEGDLDGDTRYSLFRLVGGASAQGELVRLGALYTHNRTE